MIYRSNYLPIIVGGTGFYIDALVGRVLLPSVPPNQKLRKSLANKSAAQLMTQLKKLDPSRAAEVDPHNKVRLIRAIEIAKVLGRVPKFTTEPLYDVLWLGLNPRDLEARIEKRLYARLRQGMLAEAKRLHANGLSYKRMEELGLEYRFMAMHLQHKLSKAAFEESLLRAIQQYAKRQMRWFKRNKDIHWVTSRAQALKLAKAFIG